MGEAIVVLFVSDEQIYLQQIGSSNEICGLYLIIPKGENRMGTLYRRYRCLVENGWWYTWHKVLFKLFGFPDPEQDPRWPQKREEFLKRHPDRRIAAPVGSANAVGTDQRCMAQDYEKIGKAIWEEQQNEISYEDQLQEISGFSNKPLISVIMPLYNAPVKWLELAIESIQNQSYTNWELCLVDDGSKDLRCVHFASEAAKEDSRIRFHRCEKNGGISSASNVALEMASGEYIALIDQDDAIPSDAFFWFVREINLHPDADFLYSDECKTDASEQIHPSCFYFKPDWSQFLLLNHMYTGHLTMYRTELVREVGGFRSQFDFSQDYDLALRMGDATKNIYHIERLLYYWRIIPSSGASGGKPFARLTNIAATHDWCKRHGIEATHDSVDTPSNFGQVKHTNNPLVSIVIPTDSLKMLSNCIDGINGSKTSYHNVEIIPVTNSLVAEQITKDYPYVDNMRIRRYDEAFNFSRKCNEGAKIAEGEYLLFYNDDVLPFSRDWIERLLDVFSYPDTGGVSPALLYEDTRIQYAGMITGTPGLVGTAFNGQPFFLNVPMGYTQYLARDVSVLSGACMMMRRDVFHQIGGFDEINMPNGHSDVDISFKLMEAGKKCVYTPFSVMTHIGNHSWAEKKKKDKSDIYCLKKWSKYIANDRFFTRSMRRAYYWDFPEEYQIYYPENFTWDFSHPSRDILFVTHELSRTGAPMAVLAAVRTAIENGDFAVVVSPEDGPLREEFLKAGAIVVVDVMAMHNDFMFRRFARNFDIAVCNTLATGWAVKALNGGNVPVLWWVHEGSFVMKHFKSIIPTDLGDNVHLFYAGEYAMSICASHFKSKNKQEILLYPVDESTISTDDILPHDSKKTVFLCCGSVEKRKGQDILMEAIQRLKPEYREKSEFLIIGSVFEELVLKTIQKCAKETGIVKWLDSMPHEELEKYFQLQDCYVLPSRDDPFPVTCMESMSLSKPVIVSDMTGTSYEITDGENGFVFASEDVDALVEKLEFVIDHPNEAREVGKNGYAVYRKNCDVALFKKRYLSILDELLGKSQNVRNIKSQLAKMGKYL